MQPVDSLGAPPIEPGPITAQHHQLRILVLLLRGMCFKIQRAAATPWDSLTVTSPPAEAFQILHSQSTRVEIHNITRQCQISLALETGNHRSPFPMFAEPFIISLSKAYLTISKIETATRLW